MGKTRKLVAQLVARAGHSGKRQQKEGAKYREFSERVESFANSDDQTLSFETSLNSYERMLVHELAEKHGLTSKSTGDGTARHVVLLKNARKTSDASFILCGGHWWYAGIAWALLLCCAGHLAKLNWNRRLMNATV